MTAGPDQPLVFEVDYTLDDILDYRDHRCHGGRSDFSRLFNISAYHPINRSDAEAEVERSANSAIKTKPRRLWTEWRQEMEQQEFTPKWILWR